MVSAKVELAQTLHFYQQCPSPIAMGGGSLACFFLSCLSGVYVVFFCCCLRVAGKRKALRVGLLSPIRRVSRTFFLCFLLFSLLYRGYYDTPYILTKSVDFINTCLLFIFFEKSIDFLFFLCYYLDIK